MRLLGLDIIFACLFLHDEQRYKDIQKRRPEDELALSRSYHLLVVASIEQTGRHSCFSHQPAGIWGVLIRTQKARERLIAPPHHNIFPRRVLPLRPYSEATRTTMKSDVSYKSPTRAKSHRRPTHNLQS